MSTEIRLAEQDDAARIVELVTALLHELGRKVLPPEAEAVASCEALISRPELGFILLAEVDGTIEAVCTVSFIHAIRTVGRHAVVQEMYVTPDLRSGGLGEQILRRAIDEAAARGCFSVELTTPVHGDRQVRFYEKLGFETGGRRLALRIEG